MKFTNVSPRGDLDLAGHGEVKFGETISVPDDLGLLLAEQPENWEPDKSTKAALAALVPAEPVDEVAP